MAGLTHQSPVFMGSLFIPRKGRLRKAEICVVMNDSTFYSLTHKCAWSSCCVQGRGRGAVLRRNEAHPGPACVRDGVVEETEGEETALNEMSLQRTGAGAVALCHRAAKPARGDGGRWPGGGDIFMEFLRLTRS